MHAVSFGRKEDHFFWFLHGNDELIKLHSEKIHNIFIFFITSSYLHLKRQLGLVRDCVAHGVRLFIGVLTLNLCIFDYGVVSEQKLTNFSIYLLTMFFLPSFLCQCQNERRQVFIFGFPDVPVLKLKGKKIFSSRSRVVKKTEQMLLLGKMESCNLFFHEICYLSRKSVNFWGIQFDRRCNLVFPVFTRQDVFLLFCIKYNSVRLQRESRPSVWLFTRKETFKNAIKGISCI